MVSSPSLYLDRLSVDMKYMHFRVGRPQANLRPYPAWLPLLCEAVQPLLEHPGKTPDLPQLVSKLDFDQELRPNSPSC